MSFIVSYSPSNAFKRVPAGMWRGYCVGLADLGTQLNEKFNKSARQIRLIFEIHGEDEQGVPLTIEIEGKDMPMTISKTVNLSMHEKANLRIFLEQWRGKKFTPEELKGFDISKLLGAPASINVIEEESKTTPGRMYSYIASIGPVSAKDRKEMPARVHELFAFDLDKPDMNIFNTFHEKLQEIIRQSPEWARNAGAKNAPGLPVGEAKEVALADMDDDVPF